MVQRFERQGLRVLQAFALWLGLAAVILQGFVPLGLGAMAGDGRSIVICTARGMEKIQVGSDGKPLATQTNNGSTSLCSVCSDCAATGRFTLPSPVRLPRPVGSTAVVVVAPNSLVPTARIHVPYTSRAPPVATPATA
jgi:hypothetical protein